MAEKVKIKIQPSGGVSTSLTVEDAMQQVLDYMDMLRAADLSKPSEKIIWRLESASTNSPLEVTAFATGYDPSIAIGLQARQSAERVSNSIETLEKGGSIPDWMDDTTVHTAERFLKRNMNGIGRTDIAINDAPPKTIVHGTAKVALLTIEKSRIQNQLEKPDWTRTEFGAVEGEIIAATSHYSKPAIIIRERLSGDKIHCILSDELASIVGPSHKWQEAWEQRRFTINGELHYNEAGNLTKINALSLDEIQFHNVNLNKIRKLDLIESISVDELDERLWKDG